jgi:hypothetical protein
MSYTLIKVLAGKNSLEYSSDRGSTTMQLETDVPIFLNGEECTIRDLRPGDKIELQSKVGKILKVRATRPKGSSGGSGKPVPPAKKPAPVKKPVPKPEATAEPASE